MRDNSVNGEEKIIPFGVFKETEGLRLLEWIVLEEKDGKALVACTEAITKRPYSLRIPLKWSNCELREWLNGELYQSAFLDEEKILIEETTLDNPLDGRKKDKTGDLDTTIDKIFLPGRKDAEYNNMDWEAYKLEWKSQERMSWWMRTVYSNNLIVCPSEDEDGVMNYWILKPDEVHLVRPVMWINFQGYRERESNVMLPQIRERTEAYWKKHQKEAKQLISSKKSLESSIKSFKDQNGKLPTIDIKGLIDKLSDHIERLNWKATNGYSKDNEKSEIRSYITKAERYKEQLEPIAMGVKDLRDEYEKMVREELYGSKRSRHAKMEVTVQSLWAHIRAIAQQ